MNTHVVISVFSILFYSMIATAAECPPNGKFPEDLNPALLKHYLSLNAKSFKKPEDLICCLSEQQNLEIAISHSSIAAQNGDYNNPRVLIVSRQKNGKLNGFLSINSGAKHLVQKDAVEFMYDNSVRGELEMYDIDFSGSKPHFSGRNPESCLNCHGTPTSPKTIMELFPWGGFANNSISDSPNTNPACPNRRNLNTLLDQKANYALKTNPRYNCIKDAKRIKPLELDEDVLEPLNNRRVAKEIRGSRDYHKFKFAIFGSELCDFKSHEWIPPQTLKEMSNLDMVDKNIRAVTNADELSAGMVDRLNHLRQEANAIEKNLTETISKIERNKSIDRSFLKIDGRCGDPLKKDIFVSMLEEIVNPIERQYRADFTGPMRFLFESRGLATDHWGMEPVVDSTSRSQPNIWIDLLKHEPKNTELKNLLGAIADREEKKNDPDTRFRGLNEGEEKRRICHKLRALSMKAFASHPNSNFEMEDEVPRVEQ